MFRIRFSDETRQLKIFAKYDGFDSPHRVLSNPILIQSFPFYRRIVEKSDPPRKGLSRRVCGGEALQGSGVKPSGTAQPSATFV